jgi:hypothetical protein
MTTGRINQVAVMRASAPGPVRRAADRRAVDDDDVLHAARERPACFAFVRDDTDNDRQATTGRDDGARTRRVRRATIGGQFSVRFSITRCGVEIFKTVEFLS